MKPVRNPLGALWPRTGTTGPPAASAGARSKIWPQTVPWSVAVGALVLVVSLALLPFAERTWRTTGDEPHYLLAAHSLVHDGDLDLSNNYAQLDYLAFYFSRDITPQVRLDGAGRHILDHYQGLPWLIAPAYALGGRYGVLLFQALVAALLAGLTFKLAATVSRDERAAFVATLLVSLSPLPFFYQYLVYPELIGALLVTLLLYLVIDTGRPSRVRWLLVIAALLVLPWLNRRFIPLALALALLLVWAWRAKSGGKALWHSPGWGALAVTVVSLLALAWFNSRLDAPIRTDITAPASGALLWLRLARGVGWLVDQQRGLLIYSPIFLAALGGLPPLAQTVWRERNRQWLILLPFTLAWGSTAAAGGYWVAWELGPRFLVVALPALAALLAVAWRHYRRAKGWVVLVGLLAALTVSNALIILQNPELPYKSSLPLYYEARLGLPLSAWLPDLAGYATLSAPATAGVTSEAGQMVWHAAPGRRAVVIPPTPLPELPFGHYRLTWPLRTEPDLPAETELLRLSATFLGGGQLFNKTITAADLPADGRTGQFELEFLNPNVDRWRTPLLLTVEGSGQAAVWGKALRLTPTFFYAWLLPYGYLLLAAGAALLTWWGVPTRERTGASPLAGRIEGGRDLAITPARLPRTLNLTPLPTLEKPHFLARLIRWLAWGLLLLLLLGTAGYLIYQNQQSHYTYDAVSLSHFVGQPVDDPAAEDGRAWRVDPAIDPPQKAIYGPFDFYEPGGYRVTYRMKLAEAVEGDQPVARLQVNATANFDELVAQPLRPEHFAKPDQYHHFVLFIDNPRRQALSFEVVYTGLAPLVIDEVQVERVVE